VEWPWPAQAQTGSRTQLIAKIPFQFNVGNKSMPAGEYTVSQVNPSSDRAVRQLRTAMQSDRDDPDECGDRAGPA
jgi:hypothetical protein